MRRITSLAAFLLLVFSQLIAPQCPLAPDTAHGLAGSHGPLSIGFIAAALHPDERVASASSSLPPGDGTECRMVMACVWAMVDPAAAAPAFALATPLHGYSGPLRAPHDAADLLADPPPPRLIA